MAYERTEAELKRDLEGMKNPPSWPRWPILPVKRYDGRDIETGIIVERSMDEGVKPVVFLNNMYGVKTWGDIFNSPKEEYDTFEALQAAGWVVD